MRVADHLERLPQAERDQLLGRLEGMSLAMRIIRDHAVTAAPSDPQGAPCSEAETCAAIVRMMQVEIGSGRMRFPEMAPHEARALEGAIAQRAGKAAEPEHRRLVAQTEGLTLSVRIAANRCEDVVQIGAPAAAAAKLQSCAEAVAAMRNDLASARVIFPKLSAGEIEELMRIY